MQVEPERLIEEVEKRPGIWKFSDVNKTSMSMRVQLWHEVATALLDPDVTPGLREMHDIVTQLQKRWRTIRDCYVKQIARPEKHGRPYIYSNLLSFLDVNYCSKGDDKNGHDSGSDKPKKTKGKREMIRVKKEIDNNTSEEEADTLDNSIYFEEQSISDDDYGPSKKPRPDKSQEFAFATTSTASVSRNPEQEDCDRMFLLSMLTHLKNIPEAKRIRVKVKLLEVLESALAESDMII